MIWSQLIPEELLDLYFSQTKKQYGCNFPQQTSDYFSLSCSDVPTSKVTENNAEFSLILTTIIKMLFSVLSKQQRAGSSLWTTVLAPFSS